MAIRFPYQLIAQHAEMTDRPNAYHVFGLQARRHMNSNSHIGIVPASGGEDTYLNSLRLGNKKHCNSLYHKVKVKVKVSV